MTILYGVCAWGLGHATRSLPILRRLVDDHRVLVYSERPQPPLRHGAGDRRSLGVLDAHGRRAGRSTGAHRPHARSDGAGVSGGAPGPQGSRPRGRGARRRPVPRRAARGASPRARRRRPARRGRRGAGGRGDPSRSAGSRAGGEDSRRPRRGPAAAARSRLAGRRSRRERRDAHSCLSAEIPRVRHPELLAHGLPDVFTDGAPERLSVCLTFPDPSHQRFCQSPDRGAQ